MPNAYVHRVSLTAVLTSLDTVTDACFKQLLQTFPNNQIKSSGSVGEPGECLVGRHTSGRAVERCVWVGVRHVGSVGLSVFRRHRPGGRSLFT
eukprot:scaffold29086_cov101-Isochrysis_galbana.AAC.7